MRKRFPVHQHEKHDEPCHGVPPRSRDGEACLGVNFAFVNQDLKLEIMCAADWLVSNQPFGLTPRTSENSSEDPDTLRGVD
jgi:hypothetical protein